MLSLVVHSVIKLMFKSYVYIPSIIHINWLIIDLVYMFLSLFFFQEHENVALLLLDKIHDSNICNIANSELKT